MKLAAAVLSSALSFVAGMAFRRALERPCPTCAAVEAGLADARAGRTVSWPWTDTLRQSPDDVATGWWEPRDTDAAIQPPDPRTEPESTEHGHWVAAPADSADFVWHSHVMSAEHPITWSEAHPDTEEPAP